MEKLLSVVFYMLTLTEFFLFYYTFFWKKLRVLDWKMRTVQVGLLVLPGIGVWKEWNREIQLYLVYAISFFLLLIIFQISLKENIKTWVIVFLMLSIIESVLNVAIRLLISDNDLISQILYVTIICILLGIYYLIIGKKVEREIFYLPFRVWIIFVGIMLVLVFMMTYFTFVLTEINPERMQHAGLFMVFSGGFIVCVLMFTMVYYFNTNQKYQFEAQLLEKMGEQQREYFEQLLKKENDTKLFRHDIINELLELKNYCQNGKYKDLEDYLDEMLGEITSISSRQYDVGNEIVNTMLNYYLQPIKNKSNVVVKGYMNDELRITQRDLCIIVSNLLKNAVEAMENDNQNEVKKVLYEVSQGKNSIYMRVENTTIIDVIRGENGIPKTTKANKEEHGIGLKNVMSVVEKYHGTYKNFVENNVYIVEIMLEI